MKKVIFLAIAAFGFTFAQGQALAAPSVNTIHTTINLANVLEMQLKTYDGDLTDAPMSASFNNEDDYEAGVILTQPEGTNYMPFWVASNRDYNVSVKAAAANFTYSGSATDDNVMPCSILSWSSNAGNTGGTAPSGWHVLTTSNATVLTEGEEGDDSHGFTMQLLANPGFDYTGGTYQLNVVVTATQF